MKQLIAKTTALAVISLFFFSSCEKEATLSREEKLEGVWAYRKVIESKDWHLFNEDLTAEYQSKRIIFYEDGYLEIMSQTTDHDFYGDWYLSQQTNSDADGNESTNWTIDGTQTSIKNGSSMDYSWTIIRLNKEEFVFEELQGKVRRKYKMIKMS